MVVWRAGRPREPLSLTNDEAPSAWALSDDAERAAVAAGSSIWLFDLTRRALQSELKAKGLPWERAKAFDGAALFSAFVALPAEVERLSLRLSVDGKLRQAGGVELMLYRPDAILAELATFITLEDGDIIMTGTPAGVGEVRAGQVFEGQVQLGDTCLVAQTWVAR